MGLGVAVPLIMLPLTALAAVVAALQQVVVELVVGKKNYALHL